MILNYGFCTISYLKVKHSKLGIKQSFKEIKIYFRVILSEKRSFRSSKISFKGLVIYSDSQLIGLAMSDLQRYPEMLFLIKYLLDLSMFIIFQTNNHQL